MQTLLGEFESILDIYEFCRGKIFRDDISANLFVVGGVSAAVSKTAAAPIERVKLLIQNQVRPHPTDPTDLLLQSPNCFILTN
jgi:hypothetical protein